MGEINDPPGYRRDFKSGYRKDWNNGEGDGNSNKDPLQ